MYTLLIIFHVIACFAIIGVVLLQSGKGADIGSAFGGAGSQAVFGSMGTPTFLGKITGGVAVLFALTSFGLALWSGDRSSSVIREPAAATSPAPAQPPAPAAPAAPAPPAGGTPAPAQPPAPTPGR
jgi:preprotein translocase subunit SecG